MRLQQELAALRIFQKQGAAAGGRDDRNQPLDDRLEQGVEFGLLAEPQRQLVEERECLCPIWIGRLPKLEHGRRGIDHCVDVETSVVGDDERPVIGAEAGVEIGLADRNLHLDRGVADPDRLAGLQPQLTFALDLLSAEFRTVGAAEILDPIVAIRNRDSRMRPRSAQIRGQIDINVDTVPRSPQYDRFARLIKYLLNAPVVVTDAQTAPSGCSF